MLPTKGYFQDIECPYYESGCGRPYCHFRHRKKLNEDNVNEPDPVDIVPTYKPTPKSELASIQSNRTHIPISYVPDLAFRPDRTTRVIPKFNKPVYKPTPLSVLSASKEQNGAIQENIASIEYNPSSINKANINFDDLNTEFDLLDSILSEDDKQVDYSPTKIEDLAVNNKKNETIGDKDYSPTKISDLIRPPTSKEETKKDTSRKSKKSDSEKQSDKKSSEGHKTSSNRDKNKEKSKDKHKSSSSSSRHDKSHKSSSRDKHRKEEKKDSKEEKKDSKEEKKDSKDEKKSSKDEKKDRDSRHSLKHKRERSKERKSSKSHRKDKSRDKSKDTKDKEKKKPSPQPEPEPTSPIVDDIFLSDDDEGMDVEDECFKIFNEYQPEPLVVANVDAIIEEKMEKEELLGKKRVAHSNAETSLTSNKYPAPKPKPTSNPGQTLADRYRQAKLAQANREQENIINEIKQPSLPVKRLAPSLLEAARQHKIKRLQTPTKTISTSLIDDIINGKTQNNKAAPSARKIAPVANFMSYQRAKERINEVAKQKAATVLNKTVAHTQKSGRVAHVPEISLSDIPDVLNIEKSKLPVNVRTRYLTLLAEECVKLYLSRDDAYKRALNEEFQCYEKCKVLATYRNSAMLAINRLRKEFQERENADLGPIESGESASGGKDSDMSGKKFYRNVQNWCLTEEELDQHGYPRESETPGHAFINNRRDVIDNSHLDENQRKCCRCGKIYQVDDDGWPLFEEECLYHPLRKRTIRGEQTYLCCRTADDTGCATSDTHESETVTGHELEGFQTTMEPVKEDDPRSTTVYALDCEMCYTTKGLELTRVTIVDTECRTIYESFVKPLNPIIDYNTRFSGITKEQMDRTSTSILQIQANILHLCNSRTILVGHSLESDLKALKIVHETIIDTSVLFPHKMGLPHKRALRVLASEYLKKIIQNDVGGHDSAEDAVTCMELIKWKLKEDLKVKGK